MSGSAPNAKQTLVRLFHLMAYEGSPRPRKPNMTMVMPRPNLVKSARVPRKLVVRFLSVPPPCPEGINIDFTSCEAQEIVCMSHEAWHVVTSPQHNFMYISSILLSVCFVKLS